MVDGAKAQGAKGPGGQISGERNVPGTIVPGSHCPGGQGSERGVNKCKGRRFAVLILAAELLGGHGSPRGADIAPYAGGYPGGGRNSGAGYP